MEPRSSADVIRRRRWELARARALRLLETFNPEQLRDEDRAKHSSTAEAVPPSKSESLPAHELFKVRVWLSLQGIKYELKEYDPNQPRDEEGKWSSDGGGGNGSAESVGYQGEKPAERPTPKAGSGSTEKAMQKVTKAIAAIPAKHAEILKNIPIEVVQSSVDIKTDTVSAGTDTVGTFRFQGDKPVGIVLAENIRMNVHRTYDLPVESIEQVTIHELGHALDHHNGWKLGNDVPFLKGINKGLKRMKPNEKRNGLYFLSDPKERFAELYSLAYNPSKSAKYFGGMSRKRAETVFAESLAIVKAL